MRDDPSIERLYSIRSDGSRRKLQPADVRGRFVRARRVGFALLIAFYLALPFVPVGGHPAVHLDIGARRFYLLGAVFNATDGWLLVFALSSFAFALLFVTAWLGRAWCGWACPQTVFLEGVFRVIERVVEGPGEKRLRRDAGPWSADKLARRLVKHALFVAVSLLLAHATLSLFVGSGNLGAMVRQDPRRHWGTFAWTMAIAALVYFDFAWFREQLCIVVCPYGRLQSALVDKDSLVIGYDARRGEPRGKAGSAGSGDCVDCRRCVAVCPTGIDIRNGLQLECIACAQCVDACDEIMTRLQRPRGLVRYDSQRRLEGGQRRRLRPRLWGYALLLTAAVAGLALATGERAPFEAVLLRAPGLPFVVDESGAVRDQFTLHLTNKSAVAARFELPARGGAADVVMPQAALELRPLESVRLPLFLVVPKERYRGPFEAPLAIRMRAADGRTQALTSSARFLGPPR